MVRKREEERQKRVSVGEFINGLAWETAWRTTTPRNLGEVDLSDQWTTDQLHMRQQLQHSSDSTPKQRCELSSLSQQILFLRPNYRAFCDSLIVQSRVRTGSGLKPSVDANVSHSNAFVGKSMILDCPARPSSSIQQLRVCFERAGGQSISQDCGPA